MVITVLMTSVHEQVHQDARPWQQQIRQDPDHVDPGAGCDDQEQDGRSHGYRPVLRPPAGVRFILIDHHDLISRVCPSGPLLYHPVVYEELRAGRVSHV